jgi:hypothetical protein
MLFDYTFPGYYTKKCYCWLLLVFKDGTSHYHVSWLEANNRVIK